jgi:hypothetical protein
MREREREREKSQTGFGPSTTPWQNNAKKKEETFLSALS